MRVTHYRDSWVFRARPNPTQRYYYTVRIFTSERAARAYHTAHRDTVGAFGRSTRGCCHTWKRYYRRGPLSPELGEIHLQRRWCGTSVITHESVHAGIGYLDRVGTVLTTKPWGRGLPPHRTHLTHRKMAHASPEEQLCRAVHEVARQIVDVVWRVGIAT